jgi:hypothetical protein
VAVVSEAFGLGIRFGLGSGVGFPAELGLGLG